MSAQGPISSYTVQASTNHGPQIELVGKDFGTAFLNFAEAGQTPGASSQRGEEQVFDLNFPLSAYPAIVEALRTSPDANFWFFPEHGYGGVSGGSTEPGKGG